MKTSEIPVIEMMLNIFKLLLPWSSHPLVFSLNHASINASTCSPWYIS